LLAPVFHTLTKNYADDTIYALAITLGFIHIVAADYDYMNCSDAFRGQPQQYQIGVISSKQKQQQQQLLQQQQSNSSSSKKIKGMMMKDGSTPLGRGQSSETSRTTNSSSSTTPVPPSASSSSQQQQQQSSSASSSPLKNSKQNSFLSKKSPSTLSKQHRQQNSQQDLLSSAATGGENLSTTTTTSNVPPVGGADAAGAAVSDRGPTKRFGNAMPEHNVSMNAAIVMTVLLASRLDDPRFTAVLLLFGVECFSLSPVIRRSLRNFSEEVHSGVSLLLCGIAFGCLMVTRSSAAAGFVAAVVGLTVILPVCFVRAQDGKFKAQIRGPWDEAVPKNSAAAKEWANAV
jgi:hypothetical protein